MAVLYNHIHSTHSIKVGNRLRSEVQEVQRLVLSLSKSLYLSQSRNKKLKILIKKILAVESLGILHPSDSRCSRGWWPGLAQCLVPPPAPRLAGPLSLLGGWADVPFPSLIPLLFRDAIISKVIWRKHILFLLALLFSLLISEAVNIVFAGDCTFFFSFLFHSQFVSK